jgi:hypothetical protein
MDEKIVAQLQERIAKVADELDETKSELTEAISSLHSDIRVLLETCKHRGKTCHIAVSQMSSTLHGNGGDGLLTRVSLLESTRNDLG